MIHKDLERLLPVIQGLWPKMELTAEFNLTLVGYKCEDSMEVVYGIFSWYSVGEVIDACRRWAIANPGSIPSGYGGTGWKEIRHELSKRSKTTAPADSLKGQFEEHREHYKGWPGWEWPGDDVVSALIARGQPTPLQQHCFKKIRELRKRFTIVKDVKGMLDDSISDPNSGGGETVRPTASRQPEERRSVCTPLPALEGEAECVGDLDDGWELSPYGAD